MEHGVSRPGHGVASAPPSSAGPSIAWPSGPAREATKEAAHPREPIENTTGTSSVSGPSWLSPLLKSHVRILGISGIPLCLILSAPSSPGYRNVAGAPVLGRPPLQISGIFLVPNSLHLHTQNLDYSWELIFHIDPRSIIVVRALFPPLPCSLTSR